MMKPLRTAAGIFLISSAFFSTALSAAPCLQIFYDSAPQLPGYTLGRRYAQQLQNLLGHFPEWQQIIIPVESYQKNQITRCQANFYLGSYFDNRLPADFLNDFILTAGTKVWIGYNAWQLSSPALNSLWGVSFKGLVGADWESKDPQGFPGFFRHFEYKGETFSKTASWGPQGQFFAPYEISRFTLVDPTVAQNILSWANHSTTNQRTPYILRHENAWLVADIPFSYQHESDRYLIFADILFDVLNEKPRYPNTRPAIARLEDIHAKVSASQTAALVAAFDKEKAPFALSLIPTFADPHKVLVSQPVDQMISLSKAPSFVKQIKDAVKQGGSIIYHGTTHQFEDWKNPQGISGIDFEFWNIADKTPVPPDKPLWVLSRLEAGWKMMEEQGLTPAAWITPHYAASGIDQTVFGQLFLWTMGRTLYSPHTKTQKTSLPSFLTLDATGSWGNGKREVYFSDLAITPSDANLPHGQFFPYEIYGDIYGQRIIPENIGFLEPAAGTTPAVFLSRLKRNRVLRDVWGSFFIHPFLLVGKDKGGIGDYPGDTREIESLIRETRALGYEFIDLKTWAPKNVRKIRPEPIETAISPSSIDSQNTSEASEASEANEAFDPIRLNWFPLDLFR